MKNVFIVLLLAAIGVGVYFYFSKKQKTATSNSKDLIVGKWKVDSLAFKKDTSKIGGLFSHLFDSTFSKYELDFNRDGSVFKKLEGKTEDTSRYEFANNSTLLISDEHETEKERWDINKLDSAVMTVRDKDSTVFYFKRIKEE